MLKEIRDIYINALATEVVAENKEDVLVDKMINKITHMLELKAKRGKRDVRVITSSIRPQVAEFFRKEGFIVWENSETTLFRIPL